MLCLSNLRRDYAPLLLIDAASCNVQVGVFAADGVSHWATQEAEAGVAIFRCIEKLGVNLERIRGFVFCEGPGSTLGIRTSAMAIRTWQTLTPRPAFAYGSLALLAHAIGRPDVTIIADARRSSWHAQKLGHPISRLLAEELKGPLVTPRHFRTWSPEPAGTTVHDYAVEHLIETTKELSLFRPIESPDAFLHHDPSFVMWSPTIHRAPVSSTREG